MLTLMTVKPEYLPNNSNNNATLRSILLRVWDGECSYCGAPTTFKTSSLDHLIPKGDVGEACSDPSNLRRYKAEFHARTSREWRVHHPENLAPICTNCNSTKKKSLAKLAELPAFETALYKAWGLREKVIKQVNAWNADEFVTSLELKVNELEHPDGAKWLDVARPIFQRLALYSEENDPSLLQVNFDKNFVFGSPGHWDESSFTLSASKLNNFGYVPIPRSQSIDVKLDAEGRKLLDFFPMFDASLTNLLDALYSEVFDNVADPSNVPNIVDEIFSPFDAQLDIGRISIIHIAIEESLSTFREYGELTVKGRVEAMITQSYFLTMSNDEYVHDCETEVSFKGTFDLLNKSFTNFKYEYNELDRLEFPTLSDAQWDRLGE